MDNILILKEDGIILNLNDAKLYSLRDKSDHTFFGLNECYEVSVMSEGVFSSREFTCKKEALLFWNKLADAIANYKRGIKPVILSKPDPETMSENKNFVA